MSLEILGQTGATTYAPLRSTIDGDRDYRDLTGLGRCNCGYQGLDATIPPAWVSLGLIAAALAFVFWLPDPESYGY